MMGISGVPGVGGISIGVGVAGISGLGFGTGNSIGAGDAGVSATMGTMTLAPFKTRPPPRAWFQTPALQRPPH